MASRDHAPTAGDREGPKPREQGGLRFRKKPVVIEAVQVRAADFNGTDFDGNPFSVPNVPWLVEALTNGTMWPDTPNHTDYAEWRIKTLEGVMLATPGDWIIRGVKGELYAIM